MAFDETNSGVPATMLVGPTGYGNNGGFGGFGGDWAWIIILLLAFNGGFGGWGGMGNWGAMGMMDGGFGLYPWLNNSQNINDGFRDQMLNTTLTGIQNSVTSGFGDVQTALCGGFAGVNATVNNAQNALAQQLYTNQISDLERSFAAQTASTQGMNSIQSALSNCCCENRAGLADVKYTIATENCADRAALSDGIRDLLAATQNQTQTILTQMCNDKLEAKNDLIAQLRQELLFARGQASQDVQTATIRAGQATTANQLVQELRSCPVPSMPVYGMTPIFSCNQNTGCGCSVA